MKLLKVLAAICIIAGIGWANNANALATTIRNAGFSAEVAGNTVTATGRNVGMTATLMLDIPEGVRVVWKASAGATITAIIVSGNGIFELAEDGEIIVYNNTILADAIFNNGSNVEITGGTVSAAGGGRAIRNSNSGNNFTGNNIGNVKITGGNIRARDNAITNHSGANLIITGGNISATNFSAISNSGGLVYYGTTIDYSNSGNGIVIRWDKPTETAGYNVLSNTDLWWETASGEKDASAIAQWRISGGKTGIYYAKGGNSGFIEVIIAGLNLTCLAHDNTAHGTTCSGCGGNAIPKEHVNDENDTCIICGATREEQIIEKLAEELVEKLQEHSIMATAKNGIVTVTLGRIGTRIPLLTIDIPNGVRVVWNANYIGSSNGHFLIEIRGAGIFEMAGGEISAEDGSGAIRNMGGNIEIIGGTIKAHSSVAISNAGRLEVSGGTVSATGTSISGATAIGNSGNLKISGGTIEATRGWTIGNNGGNVEITGGHISATRAFAISNTGGGNIEISGGNIRATGDLDSRAVANSGNNSVVKISGGVISSQADFTITNTGKLIIIVCGANIQGNIHGNITYLPHDVGENGICKVCGATRAPQIAEEISAYSNKFITSVNGGTVTVTGELTDIATTLKIDIPAGVRVVWKAKFVVELYSVLSSNLSHLIEIQGAGTFEIADGGEIIMMATVVSSNGVQSRRPAGTAIRNNSGNIEVTGGNVGGIFNNAGNVKVLGGNVEAQIINANGDFVDGRFISGNVKIFGGVVSDISNRLHNNVIISGGRVGSITNECNLEISGGIIGQISVFPIPSSRITIIRCGNPSISWLPTNAQVTYRNHAEGYNPHLCGSECSSCGERGGTNCDDVTSILDQKNKPKHGVLFANSVVNSGETAKFAISTPEQAQITLTIFDNLGNVLNTQTLKTDRNGDVSGEWNLTNEAGRFVSAGTYLVIVEAVGLSRKRYHYSARLGVKR